MKKIISILFLVPLLLVGTAYSQASKTRTALKLAEKEYKDLRFSSAIKYLDLVLAADSANLKAQEMMAYSQRNLRHYEESLAWFSKLCSNPGVKPVWALHYAEALANNQRYEESENWYRRYLKLMPTDKRATSFVKAGDFSVKDNAEWKVTKTRLSTAASEYSPVYYQNGLLFCSNRLNGKPFTPVFGWDQTPYSNLYYVENLADLHSSENETASEKRKSTIVFNDDDTAPTSNDNRTLNTLDPLWLKNELGDIRSALPVKAVKGKVNTKFNEGPGVITPEGFLFTRNNYQGGNIGKSSNGTVKLKLYLASGSNWDKISSFPYNSDEFSTGHPAISKDGNILIFASDRPGGFGGADLYYAVRLGSGKQWGKPVNLGPKINTEGDELFPYLDAEGILFFSSTGYAGFGGLDIFEVELKDLRPKNTPKNLGAPINSFADDFGIIRSADGRSGYFSSNREGSDDIYQYERQSFHVKLRGTIVDAQTKVPVRGTEVFLRHANGIDTLIVNRRGEFAKELTKETDYELIGYHPNYVSKRQFITSVGITSDSTIVVNMMLDKAEKSQLWVSTNCDSLKRLYSVPNIYYDLDKSYIREDAKGPLDKLVNIMKQYPEISVISASHCDSRASAGYNKALSLRRGEAAKAYLVQNGIAADRVRVEYYGKSRLVNRCYEGVPCSEEDQQLNRRTEFDIIVNGVNLSQMECK